MIKKTCFVILIALIMILTIGYLKESMFNNDMFYVYVKVNDDQWEKVISTGNSSIVIKASLGDTVFISLLENSTILYEWQTQTVNLKGLELKDKYKDPNNRRLDFFKNLKDGENFDRVVFEFEVTKAGDESLSFVYKPKEDKETYDYEKRAITFIIQK